MVRVLDFRVKGRRLESNLGSNCKTLTVHPAVNGYLTIIGESLRW